MKKYKYKCWNNRCKAYAGYGYTIPSQKPIEKCPYCDWYSLENTTGDPPGWFILIAAALGGGVIGYTLGTAASFAVGFIMGLIAGGAFMSEDRKPPKKGDGDEEQERDD